MKSCNGLFCYLNNKQEKGKGISVTSLSSQENFRWTEPKGANRHL